MRRFRFGAYAISGVLAAVAGIVLASRLRQGDVTAGTFSAQQAMDRLAAEMDDLMARMQAADEANNAYSGCGPRLNEPQDAAHWLAQPGAPWPPAP